MHRLGFASNARAQPRVEWGIPSYPRRQYLLELTMRYLAAIGSMLPGPPYGLSQVLHPDNSELNVEYP